jgi:tryptophan synthase alpha chain
MNRIEKKFKDLRVRKKKAFIAYLTAGYPDLKTTEHLVRALSQQKVDIIELGVPFSDPMADGRVIQDASHYALTRGIHLGQILALVKRLRRSVDIPLCLMTYFNPVFRYGCERFVAQASACGVDGVIIPDLPPEEAGSFMRSARRENLDMILFLSPTTSVRRARLIVGLARGFIYYVSSAGVTGVRRQLPHNVTRNLRHIKTLTDKPVCVGFGISNAAQVAAMSAVCDGVIVGSAIMKKIQDNLSRGDLIRRVSRFVAGLQLRKG